MFAAPSLVTPLEIYHEVQISIALFVLGWFMLFPIKTFFKKMKDTWQAQETLLREMKEELVTQRTNCLKTLQEQGTEQIKVLGKVSDTLDRMHTSQAEMSGYLKGGLR